jgi:multiple sugar transport system ATP-binding protein
LPGVAVKELWKRYGSLNAVKGVSFNCEMGTFFCLLGPSGAGKSSILKMIAGVEEITRGEVYIDDHLVNNVRPQERDTAMMFENYALYPHMSVFENMASPYRSPLRKSQYSRSEIETTIKKVARLLSMEELLDRYPKELSGGQKQRVALGRALVRNPSVFLLDEPISHLDAKLRHNMRTELKKIHEQIRVSFIYATPDYLEAISMADRVAVLNEGEIQQLGTPSEIFDFPVNEFVAGFVGDPPMNLFECTLHSDKEKLFLGFGHSKIMLPDDFSRPLKARTYAAGLKVGIRPTQINVSLERRDENSVPADLLVFEPLGRYAVLTVRADGLILKIKSRERLQLKEDQSLWLNWETSKFHFFDKATGLAVGIHENR